MKQSAFHRNQSGLAGIEFAITASVLVLVFIAVIDLGTGFFRRMQVQAAAQRGAIYASVHGFDSAGMSNAIASAAGSPSAIPAPSKFCGCPSTGAITAVSCGTNCTISGVNVAAGTYVSASAQATYTPLLKSPWLASTLSFQASQVVRIQ